MILQNNFYTILEKTIEENNKATFKIQLNPQHVIYKAHFQGNPITPGACIVQIIKELNSIMLNKSLKITEIKNLKFINIIIPQKYPEVTVQISLLFHETILAYQLKGTVYAKEKIFAKFSFIMNHY